MVKWIFTIILAFNVLTSSAQYVPFPQENAIWEGSFIGFVGFPQKQYYVLCGDTVFNNQQYTKLYSIQVDTSGNVIGQSFMSGLREDGNKKIWMNSGQDDLLLYDFNLEPGDTFPAAYYYSPDLIHELVVDSIGETEVGGEMRRTIFFESDTPFLPEFWIEGIGSNYNILDRGLDLSSITDYEPYLECFRLNNELLLNLYPGESECTFEFEAGPECAISTNNENPIKPPFSFDFYPNPAQNYVHLNITGAPSFPLTLRLSDVFGKTVLQISPIVANQKSIVLSDLSPGMYYLQLIDPATQTRAIKKLLIQQ